MSDNIKITETIELSIDEFKEMQELMNELNININEFINISVRDAISTACGRNI